MVEPPVHWAVVVWAWRGEAKSERMERPTMPSQQLAVRDGLVAECVEEFTRMKGISGMGAGKAF